MEFEGLVCPKCSNSLNEKELAEKLSCPHCNTKFHDKKYIAFIEYLMMNGYVQEVDFFDKKIDKPIFFNSGSGFVLARIIIRADLDAWVIQVLLPVTRYLSPVFLAVVVIEPKSEPLSGSVNTAAGISSPEAILGNNFFF